MLSLSKEGIPETYVIRTFSNTYASFLTFAF